MFRKALSRVLAEIILIIVVLACVAGAYFVYSTYFSASAYTVDAQVDGKLVGNQLIVNIKNTGSYVINNMTVMAINPSTGVPTPPIAHSDPAKGTDLALAPGKSMVVKFDLTVASQGATYTIVLQIESDNGGSITKPITVIAM
jgi:flagellar basal body-associated protein FliL